MEERHWEGGTSPAKLVLVTLLSVAAVEILLTLFVLPRLPDVNLAAEAIFDAAFLGGATAPLIYLLLFRPMERENRERVLAERRFRRLVETAPVGVFRTTFDGDILYANLAIADVFGYDSVEQFRDEGAASRYADPEDREEFLERLREHGEVYRFETRMVTKTGDTIDVFFSGALVGDQITGVMVDVTERKESEDKLRRSREELHNILDSLNDAVFLHDPEGDFLFVNETAVERLGYPEEELLDMGVQDIDAPEYAESLEQHRDELVREGSIVEESVHVAADGELIPVEINSSTLTFRGEEAVLSVARDITERKEAERELREREERYSSLVQSSNDAVVSIDDDRNIVLWNEAAAEIFGYTEEEALGTDARRLFPEDDVDTFNEALERLRRAGEGFLVGEEQDIHILTGSGERIPVEMSLSSYTVGDKRVYTGIVRDISDRLERQRRIRRQEEELGVLDRVLRHNLRNEINVVQGQAELLEDAVEDPGARERLEKIQEKTQTILDRSDKARRVREAYSRSARHTAVDVVALTRDVVEDARNRYPGAEIRLDAPKSLRARADETFSHALTELVENAVEHNDADTPEARITLAPTDGHVEVRVEDNGPGIPEEERTPIVEGEETAMKHASGVGLWLAKWFVEVNEGEMEFEETEDGSAVTLRLERPRD